MPKRYRKKPVVIEAIPVGWETWNDICDFISKDAFGGGVYLDIDFEITEDTTAPFIGLYINTSEGKMLAKHGDYIIKGVQGEFYPCKPDIFEATYETVDNEADLYHALFKRYGFTREQAKDLLANPKSRAIILSNMEEQIRNEKAINITVNTSISKEADIEKIVNGIEEQFKKELNRSTTLS